MATDEFEGMSLEALNAMLASAKPAELTGAGQTLGAAAPDIASIARDLRWYIEQVKWHGAGGDAFREWGRGMVSETYVLSEYAAVTGEEMARAGQALTEAKAAVPAMDTQCYADPEKEKARLAAVAPKTNEAINQLNRLSSFYDASRDRIAAQREPKFAPPPAPGLDGGERAYGTSTGASGGTRTTDHGTGAVQHTASSSGSTYAPAAHVADTRVSHESVIATPTPVRDRVTSTTIDSTAVAHAPDATTAHPTTPVVAPTGGTTHQPVTMPVPGLPVGGLRPVPPVTSTPGGLRGISVARPSGGTAGLPRTPVTAPEGITGGRPTPTGGRGTTPRLPMGTVVGEERAGTGMGRPPMGGGMGHGPGGAPRGAMGTGGRRLASEPGGTVGAPRASSAGRGEFTPGGTGLVNGNKRGSDRRRSTSSSAPDYLVEDEETWAMDHRKVVPPVVD